jgi:exonuclease III
MVASITRVQSSAFKRVEFISDRMSCIILRGRWCDVVLNVRVLTEGRTDDMKDRFYEKLEHIFHKFRKYHMKILLGDFNVKVGRETFSSQANNWE